MCAKDGDLVQVNEKMKLRLAKENEFKDVQSLYWKIIELMDDAEYKPGWKKGIYPTDEFIHTALTNQELYVVEEKSTLIAAMVMNHTCTDGYEKIEWGISAYNDEVSVIHALGILPLYQGKGVAKFLVKEAIKIAQGNQQKAIRLDVLGTNIPAQKLYTKMGFQYRDTLQLYYEDTGLTDYMMYEYNLEDKER